MCVVWLSIIGLVVASVGMYASCICWFDVRDGSSKRLCSGFEFLLLSCLYTRRTGRRRSKMVVIKFFVPDDKGELLSRGLKNFASRQAVQLATEASKRRFSALKRSSTANGIFQR